MTLAKRTAPLKDRTLAQERKAAGKAVAKAKGKGERRKKKID
jgi:hypothetical protein